MASVLPPWAATSDLDQLVLASDDVGVGVAGAARVPIMIRPIAQAISK
jgi:hypothetical protein